MNVENNFSEPTPEEVAAYFSGFTSFHPGNVLFARQAMDLPDSMDKADDSGNPGQVGKDSPTVIAFADGVKKENRDAIMFGVAFAEMAASRDHDIKEKPIKWLESYSTALRYCGWSMTGGHDYSDYKSSSQSLTMDSVVLEIIGAIAGPNAATVIQLLSLTLDKLQKDKPLMELFERNSKKGSRGTFRIMPCVESSEGTPITYMVSMHCEYSDETGGIPFFKWEVRSIRISRLAKGLQFTKSLYELAEPRIKKALGDDLDRYFDDF